MSKIVSDAELSALMNTRGQYPSRQSNNAKSPIALLYLQQLYLQEKTWWDKIHLETINRVMKQGAAYGMANISLEYSGMALHQFSEWKCTLENPVVLQKVTCKNLPSNLLFVMPSDFIFHLIESHFGGAISQQMNLRRQEFSLMELRIINSLSANFLSAIESVWSEFCQITLELGYVEYNPKYFNMVLPDDYVFVVDFNLQHGNSNVMQCVIPNSVFQSIRKKISKKSSINQVELKNSAICENLFHVPLELRTILAEDVFNLSDILKLKAGDLLPVVQSDELLIKIENEAVFLGKFDRKNCKTKVKIVNELI